MTTRGDFHPTRTAASSLSNREFCRQRGIAEKNIYYWQHKHRTQIVELALPQLVLLESPALPKEQLGIQYRGSELKLPDRVDMDAVAAL